MSLLKMECIALHGRVPPFQNTVEYIDALARVKSQNGDRANELFIEPINETLQRLSYCAGRENIRLERWGPLVLEAAD
jgi:hypothetical protein